MMLECDSTMEVVSLRESQCAAMPNKIFDCVVERVGGRKNSSICCWDVRSSRQEVGRVSRHLDTNQRLTFDLDPWATTLATGTQDGK